MFLLEKGITVQQADYQGATALHFAAFYRMAHVTARILARHGNPNATDEHGNTPLWTAVLNARGNYQLVQLLVDARADPPQKQVRKVALKHCPSNQRRSIATGAFRRLRSELKRSGLNTWSTSSIVF
ncbi:hypothetical protein GCM10028822_05360 [Hymenobacter terrigena]